MRQVLLKYWRVKGAISSYSNGISFPHKKGYSKKKSLRVGIFKNKGFLMCVCAHAPCVHTYTDDKQKPLIYFQLAARRKRIENWKRCSVARGSKHD